MSTETVVNLAEHRIRLAGLVTDRQFADHPELATRWGPAGRRKCTEDAAYHLEQIEVATRRNRPEMLAEYLAWVRELLAGLGIGESDLDRQLDRIAAVLGDELLDGDEAVWTLEDARELLGEIPKDTPSFLDPSRPLGPLARRYLSALLDSDRRSAMEMILAEVDGGASIREIYLEVFQRCLWEVGRLWQLNQLSVAQEHFCTAATQMVISQMYPRLFSGKRSGRVVVATSVAGELHEIGVRMVADFFEMEGWDSHYLGASTPVRDVVQTVADRKADLVAISATLNTSLGTVAEVIQALRDHPDTSGVPILIGGRAIRSREGLVEELGADATAEDGDGAILKAHELVT